MIDDIVFDDVYFFIFEKGAVTTGQIISYDLQGGSIASTDNVASGEVYI